MNLLKKIKNWLFKEEVCSTVYVSRSPIDIAKEKLACFRVEQRQLPKPKRIYFKQAREGDEITRLAYIRYRWYYFNETKFSNKLEEPRFSFRAVRYSWASWAPTSLCHTNHIIPEMAFKKKIFKESKKVFDMVLLHEMCHQAHSELGECPVQLTREEICKHYLYERQGHHASWYAWMKLVGGDLDIKFTNKV